MKKRLIGMIAAGGAVTAALAVTVSPAQAASQVPVAVYRGVTSGQVHSVKVNGQCAPLNGNGNNFYTNVTVDPSVTPQTLTYSGYQCETSSQNSQVVRWDGVLNGYDWVEIGKGWA